MDIDDQVIKIELLGQEYHIRTKAEPEKVMAAADIVRGKLEEYREATRTNVKLNVAILAALDIANELIQLEDTCRQLEKSVEKWARELIDSMDERIDLTS